LLAEQQISEALPKMTGNREEAPSKELEASMIDKCFNPACGEKLLHLRSGRVVRIVRNDGNQFTVEHYWLCGDCYASKDFAFGPHASISLVSKLQKTPVADFDFWREQTLVA
jgi:hypothetical protein